MVVYFLSFCLEFGVGFELQREREEMRVLVLHVIMRMMRRAKMGSI